MTDDEVFDRGIEGVELEDRSRNGTRRRLKIALSCSAVAGLVLVGDFVRQADARAESAAGAKKLVKHPKPSGPSPWVLMIPWIISLLSVVALIIVIVATT